MRIGFLFILFCSCCSSAFSQSGFIGASPAAGGGGGGGLTFDQLAASNSFAIYDLTKQGYTLGQPNISMLDNSGNSHTIILVNSGPYATNNAAELNATNWWTYDNGVANSTRWASSAFTTAQPITIYALIRIKSFVSTSYFWDGGAGNTFAFKIASGPNAAINAGTDNTGGSITANQWVWYEVHYNGANSFAKMNDATTLISTGNAGSGSLTQIEIGDDSGHNFFNQMDWAYISYHNANMSSGFSTQFYAAAKARFGSQLP